MSGEELRAIRLSLGMSQRDLGRELSYSQSVMSRMESGRRIVSVEVAEVLLLFSMDRAQRMTDAKRMIEELTRSA